MRVRELLALIMSLVLVGTAGAQEPVAVASAGGMTIEDLHVTVSKSLVIDYPADISRISTSNPDVVDAVPATSREFLLHGKGHGSATVVVWAKTGLRTMYNVTVEHNLEPIKRLLKDTFPNENIGLVAGRDSITLIGTVSSKEVADRAVAIATPLAKTVVSNMSLTAAPVSKQIVLKVRFAELDRTQAQQFGVNLVSTGVGNTTGAISTQQFSPPTVTSDGRFTVSDALNIFAFRPDLNMAALVKALQAQGVLQILAEPNLVTTNGKEASFLVGGEFPVPVLQGGSNAGAVTIQFREFGIRLTFNPQMTENNTIKLYVKPEVSTIDLANAVTFSGFTIPALATRRMETNIELGAGQSFVIAGLIDDRVNESFNKIPGLANIPILGSLFRSRTENRSKSELVIIVTPEMATPINAGDPKPEPAWLRQFLPDRKPGDKVGADLVPGVGGAVVQPMPANRNQINRNSVGNGSQHILPPTSAAPDAKPGPKAEKAESEPGKGNRLKFWGRKPASASSPSAPKASAAGAFQYTTAGERPLTRATEDSPSAVPVASPEVQTTPMRAGENAQAETVPVAAPVEAPATAPALELPAAPAATPVAAPAPAEAGAAATKETKETVPAAPVEANVQAAEPKPVAAVAAPIRRNLSAGITSLPMQVLSGGSASSSAARSSTPGAQR